MREIHIKLGLVIALLFGVIPFCVVSTIKSLYLKKKSAETEKEG